MHNQTAGFHPAAQRRIITLHGEESSLVRLRLELRSPPRELMCRMSNHTKVTDGNLKY